MNYFVGKLWTSPRSFGLLAFNLKILFSPGLLVCFGEGSFGAWRLPALSHWSLTKVSQWLIVIGESGSGLLVCLARRMIHTSSSNGFHSNSSRSSRSDLLDSSSNRIHLIEPFCNLWPPDEDVSVIKNNLWGPIFFCEKMLLEPLWTPEYHLVNSKLRCPFVESDFEVPPLGSLLQFIDRTLTIFAKPHILDL